MLLLFCLGATGQANYDLTKMATERLDRGVIATRIKIELKHTDKSVAQISLVIIHYHFPLLLFHRVTMSNLLAPNGVIAKRQKA